MVRHGDDQRQQEQQTFKQRPGHEDLPQADAVRHRMHPGDENIGDSRHAEQKQHQPDGNAPDLPLDDPQDACHQPDNADGKRDDEHRQLELTGAVCVVQHRADAAGKGIQGAEGHENSLCYHFGTPWF